MSDEHITRVTLETVHTLGPDMTDWARVDALTEEDIEAAIRDDPDAAPILDEEWFKNARVVTPPGKDAISTRLDRDVLEWFRASGEPYQTKINAVLRAFMDHEKAKSGR